MSGKKTRLIDTQDAFNVLSDYYHHNSATQHLALQEALNKVPTADVEPHWIPCSDRLPEEDSETGKGVQYSDFVLMSVDHKEDEETIVDYGHTVDGKWYSDYTDCFIPQEWKVIAWMPLPKPYEVKE